METEFKATPRTFEVKGVTLKDCGKIKLDQDEMVSFVTPEGRECDFTAKSWGFYLGPSVNGRLKNEGFKTALTANPDGRLYILAVEEISKVCGSTGMTSRIT